MDETRPLAEISAFSSLQCHDTVGQQDVHVAPEKPVSFIPKVVFQNKWRNNRERDQLAKFTIKTEVVMTGR